MPTSDGGTSLALDAAVAAGDLDGVDRATQAVTAHTTASELVTALADLVVPRLSAAGHGSIFLYHLPRLLPTSPVAATMARGLLREIARQPSWQLRWMDERAPDAGPSGGLVEPLLTPSDVGDPGSNFISPTMALVERSGLAAQLLDAPTRRITISQAPPRPPSCRCVDVTTFLDAGPAAAAAAVWHVDDDQLGSYVRRLVTVAAIHEDAHLAKYTLACLDATRDDPAAGRLFLAAAAHLSGWWRQAHTH